jgi:MoxR-like ATPase
MKASELREAILALAQARQPFFVWGDPGIGKSQIVEQVADELFAEEAGYSPSSNGILYKKAKARKRYGLPGPNDLTLGQPRPWLTDLRAVLLDPVDLMGIPVVNNGTTRWAPPGMLPQSGQGLLFFDELNRAPLMVQNGCLQIILPPHRLGEYQLPEKYLIGAAGNFEKEAGVQRMDNALRSRFTHLTLEVDVDDWCRHAASREFHPAVVAFIRWRRELLHRYDKAAVKQENTFPCPRTWEFVSRICQQPCAAKVVEFELISGSVGKAAAGEFVAFLQLYRDLPDLDAIVRDPQAAPLPSKPATAYAISSALSRMANNGNAANIISYLDRLPEQEYAVLTVREMEMRDPALARIGAVTDWKVRHPDVVF